MLAISALAAALEQGGWNESQNANIDEAVIREYFTEANFRTMFPGEDATECGGYTLAECAEAVIRWQREVEND